MTRADVAALAAEAWPLLEALHARGLCDEAPLVCMRGLDAWVAGAPLPPRLRQALAPLVWRDTPDGPRRREVRPEDATPENAAGYLAAWLVRLAVLADAGLRAARTENMVRAWLARCRAVAGLTWV